MRIIDLLENKNQVWASREKIKIFAQNLEQAMPQYRFKPDKKASSPITYVRVFNADRDSIMNYFKQFDLENLPLEPQQSVLSSKYRNNILSYKVENEIYTLVVASSGKSNDDGVGVSVSIKEFTPTVLGLAKKGNRYTKKELITATRAAVKEKTKTRLDLQNILLGLLDIAETKQGKLLPELNDKLKSRSRDQLSVDFGEVLAPILIAGDEEIIEFPSEGNYPLVDVIVGGKNYSVKSLTGSGTSFKSISDLMDSYEKTIDNDEQKKLYSLFKGFHPSSGGKNVDKLIRAAELCNIPEFATSKRILGGNFSNYSELQSLLAPVVTGNSPQSYRDFLNLVFPIMTAGGWDKPTGLPADGKYYMTGKGERPREKEAGYPSWRANPLKAATDILTYCLGVGTLNLVTKGQDSEKYSQMMTKIVNQSQAYLGKLDITDQGSIKITTDPFSKLNFKFQYHAPSHKPGNNLPGFMIIF